ncbi:hypothetical protein OLQ22_00725 [Campylobacter jejuni]|nr:hypothetical protein [Campylobacter jejuni]
MSGIEIEMDLEAVLTCISDEFSNEKMIEKAINALELTGKETQQFAVIN